MIHRQDEPVSHMDFQRLALLCAVGVPWLIVAKNNSFDDGKGFWLLGRFWVRFL
jgi:hypothetical protein